MEVQEILRSVDKKKCRKSKEFHIFHLIKIAFIIFIN